MRFGAALVLCLSLVGCGASPAYRPDTPPTGTLVIVVRQGPDRVPFQPKVDRIRRANEQLARILGHSIQIELDGSLLPQDHDGAEDVITELVETIANDLAELKKFKPKALVNANASFERLVVRYSPVEAQQRGRRPAVLDKAQKTIDVVVGEARWIPFERGEVGRTLVADEDSREKARYETVLPDAIPAREHRDWFDFWRAHNSKRDSPNVVGSVDALRVRGMLMLTSDADPALAADARKYVLDRELSNFSSAYHHSAAEIEGAPQDAPFHVAERALVDWLNRESPRLALDERAMVARSIWITDFRKDHGDRFATYAYPGFDPMAFSLATIDLWISQGHPSEPPVFRDIVAPATSTVVNGELEVEGDNRSGSDHWFYRWAMVNPQRREVFARALLDRTDPAFIVTAFYNAHSVLRDEGEYLAFLRRFEASPVHWTTGSQVHRVNQFRPSEPLLEESKRWWRQLPVARGFALFYFARKAEGSYHPAQDWDDMLQNQKPDDAALSAMLDLGWPAFQLLPILWPALPKTNGRVKTMLDHARPLLDASIRAEPGRHDVAGTLADVARLLCHAGSIAELDQLYEFATLELPRYPGAGLSAVADESKSQRCHSKASPPRPPPNKKTFEPPF